MIPTMVGFEWSTAAAPDRAEAQDGSDGWCVRDAFCQLLGWAPHSAEWSRFIEWPNGADISRLVAHLGLTVFEIEIPEDWNEIIQRSAHPGVALFDLHDDRKSHVVYVHDVRWLLHHWPTPDGWPIAPGSRKLRGFGWPLDQRYLARGPLLGAVIVDERQPPRLS